MAEKKAGREAGQGLIESYVHAGRIGALIELNCETDFVARTDDFKTLAREIAMQVAATNPGRVSGQEASVDGDVPLLDQPYIRDPGKTIQDLVNERHDLRCVLACATNRARDRLLTGADRDAGDVRRRVDCEPGLILQRHDSPDQNRRRA